VKEESAWGERERGQRDGEEEKGQCRVSAADVAQVSRPKRRLAGTRVANVCTLQENQQPVTSGNRVWRAGLLHSIIQ
jgi:hypothetical protein